MERDPTQPGLDHKAGMFEDIAYRNLALMRLQFQGKLTSKEGWRNVWEHELVQMAAAEVIADGAQLSPQERQALVKAAGMHDARKHIDRFRERDFSPGEQNRFESTWTALRPDADLIHATGPAFQEEALRGNSTFLQRLQFYLDDIAMGSDIVPFTVRTAEVQLRNPNPYPQVPSGQFWEQERELCNRVQQELFERMRANGVDIPSPAHIPSSILSALEQKMLEQNRREIRDLPPLKVRRDFVLEQRRGDPEKNEDRVCIDENQRFVTAGAFDGATAFADIPYFRDLGRSPGGMAADIAAETMNGLTPNVTPGRALILANAALRREAASMPVDPQLQKELFSAVGAVAQLDKKGRILRFASIGDCAIPLLAPDGKITWLTVNVAARFEEKEIATAMMIHQKEGIPMKETLGHPAVQEIIAQHRRGENDPAGRGYGALKGSSEEQIMMYMQEGMIAVAPGSKIFLLTDGMLPPAPSFREQCKLAEEPLKQGGIHALLKFTRELQEQDPDCAAHPRLKQFDDAGGVEIAVE